MRYTFTGIGRVLLTGFFILSGSATANEPAESASLDSVAAELMNPIGRLFAIDNRLFFKTYQGDLPDSDQQTHQGYVFEPVIPFGLPNGRRLVLRFALPITFSTPAFVFGDKEYGEWLIRQRADILDDSGYFVAGHGHLDDITYDLAYGDTGDDGRFWMVGLAGSLPTSQDGSIERDQYLLGPQFAIGRTCDRGIFGVWARHLVDVADSSRGKQQHPVDWETNETRIRLIFARGLGNGWQLVSNPELVYDWEGLSGNDLLIPLGGGVAKTFQIGRIPVRANLEAYYYVATTDAFGPEWQFNFSLAPVLSFGSLGQ